MAEMPSLTQQRHRDNLTRCLACLKAYLQKKSHAIDSTGDFALTVEELRKAVKWIGNITGHVTTEEILDVIFRDFCIGK
jgi:tRNA modification GTPase